MSANSTTNLASVAAMASWSLFSKFVFCSILMTWNFTVDGSTKMPNGHMDAIEPYDYRAFQPFSTAYLPGYMADKYDEDADTCQARAHSRMQNSVSSELSASITGYNNVSTLSENISIDYTAKALRAAAGLDAAHQVAGQGLPVRHERADRQAGGRFAG